METAKSKSVKFTDLRHSALGTQIGNGVRFGRQGLGEPKINKLVILERARRTRLGWPKSLRSRFEEAATVKIRDFLTLAEPKVWHSTICQLWGTAAANLQRLQMWPHWPYSSR